MKSLGFFFKGTVVMLYKINFWRIQVSPSQLYYLTDRSGSCKNEKKVTHMLTFQQVLEMDLGMSWKNLTTGFLQENLTISDLWTTIKRSANPNTQIPTLLCKH